MRRGHNFRDLQVWQKSMLLVTEVYRMLRQFPNEEMFALSSQLRRSVVSIPSNIAEGNARYHIKDICHFLYIAQGSRAEVETQLEIAFPLGYIRCRGTSSSSRAMH